MFLSFHRLCIFPQVFDTLMLVSADWRSLFLAVADIPMLPLFSYWRLVVLLIVSFLRFVVIGSCFRVLIGCCCRFRF